LLRFAAQSLTIRNTLQHLRDGSAVLRVQVGVDFVKEIEWRGIASLNGEHEREGAETYYRQHAVLERGMAEARGAAGARELTLELELTLLLSTSTYSSAHRSIAESAAGRRACY